MNTVVADVETTSTPARIDSFDGLIRYDLRRIEVTPGRFVQEYTVKVHLRPGAGVDSDTVGQVASKARQGVDDLLNRGFRLPSGDQFHLNLEFTDVAGDAHTVVEVGAGGTDQIHWNPTASANVLAHETLHYLGVPDEYDDARRVFLRHDTNSGVHRDDGGMMGADVLGDDPGLRPRHLWLVERTANSQVSVPDTRLDADQHPAVRVGDDFNHDGAQPEQSRPAPDRGTAERDVFDDLGTSEPVKLKMPFEKGQPLGGNSGVHLHEVDGQRVAIKPSSPRAAKTELLAQALFRAVGAPTLQAKAVLLENRGSRIHLMSDFVEGGKPDESDHAKFAGHPDVARFAAADMLLSNWDSHKNDAYIADGRRVRRIDVGGSLDLRAQGGVRDGWTRADTKRPDFVVEEIKPDSKMRAGGNGPFENLTDEQVADSIRTVADRLTPDAIDNAIKDSGYPPREGAELKEVLQARINKALDWADQVYPVREIGNASYGERLGGAAGANAVPSRPSVDDDNSRTAPQQLVEDFAYHPTEDLSDPSKIAEIRAQTAARNESQSESTLSVRDSPAVNALGPPPFKHVPNAVGTNPEVGPEELLRASQFGEGPARRQFAENSKMLEGGVLIRRASDDEVKAFENALASRDLDAIERTLFRLGDSTMDARGEIVWSLNDTYRFDREKSSTTEPGSAVPDGAYQKVLEIPVTATMASHLARTFYVNNPVVGAKPEAFRGNPTQKKEGAAGGAKDPTGRPNVVIKRNDFAGFWSTVQKIRVVDAAAHVSAHKYQPVATEDLAQRESQRPDAVKRRQDRLAAKESPPHRIESDDEMTGGMFDDDSRAAGSNDEDPPRRSRPAPAHPAEHDRGAPPSQTRSDDDSIQNSTEATADKGQEGDEAFKGFGTPRRVSGKVPFDEGEILGGNSVVRQHEVDGRQVAIKPSSPRAAKTELFAQALFDAVGAPTLRATPVLVEGKGSQIHLMSDLLDGTMPDKTVHAKFAGHPDVARFAAADMLLSNWDSHKNDAYISEGRRVWRIDVGGSLDRRAQGEVRPGWTRADTERPDFDVEEIKPDSRMRTKVGGPYQHLTDAQVADSIRTVADLLTPRAIDTAITNSGYPPAEGAELKDVLLARIASAREWADEHYPAEEIENRSFGTVLSAAANPDHSGVDDDDVPPAHQQLVEDFDYDPLLDLSDPRVIEALRSPGRFRLSNHQWGDDESESVTVMSVSDSPAVAGLGVPPFIFEQKVDATNPDVGPEELLRTSQFGGDPVRRQFAENSTMLKGGVLIRRVSDAEVEAFKTALASNDLGAIQRALFRVDGSNSATGPAGSSRPATTPPRGEIVWSVNDTYRFNREQSGPAARGSAANPHDPGGYKKILEIPVTAEMAELLSRTAYANSPVVGAKPGAFLGNPTQKNEGAAGGAKDPTGVPNEVIKRHGFAGFWSTVQKIRVFDAAEHVSAKKYEPRVETTADLAQRESQKPEAERKRQDRAVRETPSVDGLSGLFDEPQPRRTRPAPTQPADHDRVAPPNPSGDDDHARSRDKGKGRVTAEQAAREELEDQQRQQVAAFDELFVAWGEHQQAAAAVQAATDGGNAERLAAATSQLRTAEAWVEAARDIARQRGVDSDALLAEHAETTEPAHRSPTEAGPSNWAVANAHDDAANLPAVEQPSTTPAPAPDPRLPARSGPNLVLGGMDIVEDFRSGNQGLDQIRRLVTEHGGEKAWDANRERLTALFSDDGLKPKVPGMLRGGKPVSIVVELGYGRTLGVDLRLDGSPAVSSLQFKENVEEYEFENSSDLSSFVGSFDEGRRTFLAGAQASLTHPNATHAEGVFGVREHQWSESQQRTDRQISGGTTVEPGTRFEGSIQGVVSYRLSGPVGRAAGGSSESVSLAPLSFHTEVAVPTRAVTDAVNPAAASDAPPRVTNSRALTGSDVVTNLQLLPDDTGPRHGPQSTTDLVSSPAMRAAFETAYGKKADRTMNEVDDWLSVELLQANLHPMTNKQPLVHHLEGIPGGRVEVHAFVESVGTPPRATPALGEQTSTPARTQMRATGETAKTEFHYGTETDSTRLRQDQISYTAQLPLPGRSRAEGGSPAGEVVGGLDGGLNVGRSTNEVTGSQFRNRSTLKNSVEGQAWSGQVRLRFVMVAPDSVSPTQRNGAFTGAVHETRAEFDALVEKSETSPTADYRGEEVHAPPTRIWGRGGPSTERNSTVRRSRWGLGSRTHPVTATDDSPGRASRQPELAGLGSMDRVTNLDLSGFHGLLDSMGNRAFGSKWNEVRPTVTAAGHLNRIRSALPGMTQHSALTSTELAGPGSFSTLAFTADIENLTYRRTLGKVMSSPSMENTEGSTTTTISTKQLSGQSALGGRGGDLAGGSVLGEVIAGANHTVRDGDRVREQQRMAVATKFEQPMAIFDGWVRIDGTLTGSKATVHESGLFPVEIAIPLSELQGSRTHDAVLPPTFDRTAPSGFVQTGRPTPGSAPERAPLTWTPPIRTNDPPAPPAHALLQTWHPTDMLVGLDPASGLAEAIRADLGPTLGKDVDKAMMGVTQQFGPQVLQARLTHQSGQQWSHDIPVTGGKITVKVKAIREAGAEYVGRSPKFETDLSVESQSSTARMKDDLTRHVEGGRIVIPFPHGSASVQVTHGGSVLPKDAPAATGEHTTPRAETTVTDTEHRVPTRVRTTAAHDLFRQPIRFEISYERHGGARLLSKVPETATDLRLTGVFSYPEAAPADDGRAGRESSGIADGPGVRLDPGQVIAEVRPPAESPAPAPQRTAPDVNSTPAEDSVAAHVLDSLTEQGRNVFGDDWQAVRAELAPHVDTRALHSELGFYSRTGERTIELKSVKGGKVVLSARIDALADPTPETAREAEFYTGGQTLQTATDTNTKTDNWQVTLQAQGTVLPVDVGVNASLLGRVDVNRATDSSNTRTANSTTGELFRKKAAASAHVGTATVRAQMSRPTVLLGTGSGREGDGTAKIDVRIWQASPDSEQKHDAPRPQTLAGEQESSAHRDGDENRRGLPRGAMVRKVVDGEQVRGRTQANLAATVSGIVASRLHERIPTALSDARLQRHLPAMTRGEEVELLRDGALRITGHAELTGLDFTGVERDGGSTNLLNEVNLGDSHQDTSAWEAGPRFMAGPHGNLGDVLRGNIMAGAGALGRSRHGGTYGQNAKVSANAKFAGSRAVFDGAATVVLTVHDGDTSSTLPGVDVHGPMLIPTSAVDLVETPSAPEEVDPPSAQSAPSAAPEPDVVNTGATGARVSTSTSSGPAGLPIARSRLQRLFGGSRGPTAKRANAAEVSNPQRAPESAQAIELTELELDNGPSLEAALADAFPWLTEREPRAGDDPAN